MSKKILVDLDFNSATRPINLPTPTAAGDAASKSYVDANIEGLAWKDSCRVASIGSNINIAAPGATIDGITMAANDRVLLKDQTATSANGIYVWNGTAAAMTRAADASTFVELEAAVVTIEEGTNTGSTFRQSQVNGTIDSSNVVWAAFGTSAPAASETTSGIAELATQAEADTGTDDLRIVTPLKMATWSGRKRKLTGNIGDNSSLSYNATHSFGTRDVQVQVYRNSSAWDTVETDVERTDTNTVAIKFSVAPTTNQYSYVILG